MLLGCRPLVRWCRFGTPGRRRRFRTRWGRVASVRRRGRRSRLGRRTRRPLRCGLGCVRPMPSHVPGSHRGRLPIGARPLGRGWGGQTLQRGRRRPVDCRGPSCAGRTRRPCGSPCPRMRCRLQAPELLGSSADADHPQRTPAGPTLGGRSLRCRRGRLPRRETTSRKAQAPRLACVRVEPGRHHTGFSHGGCDTTSLPHEDPDVGGWPSRGAPTTSPGRRCRQR